MKNCLHTWKGGLLPVLSLLAVSATAQVVLPDSGCYLSRKYEGGLQDSLQIKEARSGGLIASFETAYCDRTSDPDCLGVRIEQYTFPLRRARAANRLEGHLGTCRVSIRQFHPRRLYVSQESLCPELKQWGVHGVYTEVEPGSGSPESCQ